MQDYPAVGIGILNWNGLQYLQQFLPFLFQISYPNYKVYVIDNQSTDESLAFLKAHYPEVQIVETGGNYGVAGGYNIGFEAMQEEYLLMLNSDIEVNPGFLEPLVELLEQNPSVAMVQSFLLSHQQRETFEYGGAAGGLMDRLGYSFCRGRIFQTTEQDREQFATQEVFWAGGACALLRRSAYWAVGGMYPFYFMHFEEVDLCWRFHRAGYKVYSCAGSKVHHVGGGTLSYQSPGKTYFNFRNNLIMLWRNMTVSDKWKYLPVRWLLDMVASLRFLSLGDRRNAAAVIKGYWAFFHYLFFVKDPQAAALPRLNLSSISTIYRGSIVWQYYIRKRHNYTQLPYIWKP